MKNILNICFVFLILSLILSICLKEEWINQIESQRKNILEIKNHVLRGSGKHSSYKRLAYIVDEYGPRMSGTPNLEKTLDYIIGEMKNSDFFDDVNTENVEVSDWKVAKASAELAIAGKKNRNLQLAVLRPSVGTKGTARYTAIVVRSFQELDKRKNEAKGSIVVYNQPWFNYSQSSEYRKFGAMRAAQYGAVAVLIRSPTPLSIYSVHSGQMVYDKSDTNKSQMIPAACITVEDAEYLQRLSDRKIALSITLDIHVIEMTPVQSRNIIAEIKGFEKPDEFVIVGGHTDSWDNDGALDDGAGFMIAWEALKILKQLDFKPKRTIRLVLWTAEENAALGSDEYFEIHHDISDFVSLIMESDTGVFNPRGLKFTGSNTAKQILKEILVRFLTDLNTTEIIDGGESSDTWRWITEKNVPGCELYTENERYFYFHHTKGDSMTVLNADELDRAAVVWASVIQVVSNLNSLLPRQDDFSSANLNFNIKETLIVDLVLLTFIFSLSMKVIG